MSKQDILDYFSDINYAYNDSTRLDTLSRMLDELIKDAAPRWHRVEEPPKQNGAFAVACVYDGKLYWYKGIYLDGKWLREGDGIEMPADYWMPLPEPPKEDA